MSPSPSQGVRAPRHPAPAAWLLDNVAHGYTVERTPLPALTDPALALVCFRPEPQRAGITNPAPGPIKEEGQAQDATAPAPAEGSETIIVPEHLTSPHTLIVAARAQLRSSKPDDSGLVGTDARSTVSIVVAPASVERALRLFDTLLKAWEQLGGTVRVGVKNDMSRPATALAMELDAVLFSMTERTEAAPAGVPPSPTRLRWAGPLRKATGYLSFKVDGMYGGGLRQSWADGKRQRLEDLLPSVVRGLVHHIEFQRLRREDHQCEGRQRRAAADRRKANEERAASEQSRREQLVADADRWHQAQRIRAYLSAMRSAIDSGAARPTNPAAFERWFPWAQWYADHIDPLVRAEPPPSESDRPVSVPLADLDLTRRTRPVLEKLGVRDSDELYHVQEQQLKGATEYAFGVWQEICLVLEALGYDVSNRRFWR